MYVIPNALVVCQVIRLVALQVVQSLLVGPSPACAMVFGLQCLFSLGALPLVSVSSFTFTLFAFIYCLSPWCSIAPLWAEAALGGVLCGKSDVTLMMATS